MSRLLHFSKFKWSVIVRDSWIIEVDKYDLFRQIKRWFIEYYLPTNPRHPSRPRSVLIPQVRVRESEEREREGEEGASIFNTRKASGKREN